MKELKEISLGIISILLLASCADKFLDAKSDVRLRIPKELNDYLGLLDNTTNMNVSSHALGIIGSDDFYMTIEGYNTFPQGVHHNYQKRAYTWEPQIFQGGESSLLDWNNAYARILWANVVLDGLDKIDVDPDERKKADMIRGIALFHRAFNYYSLSQLFCPAYLPTEANRLLGLPLRLDGDLTTKIGRSNLKETYEQILKDLHNAEQLLPEMPIVAFRPSKAATYALLARTKLQMEDYEGAYSYANQCLAIKNQLLDYNSLDFASTLTFSPYGEGNPEVIFMTTSPTSTLYLLLPTFHYMNADTNLIASYESNDLRINAYWMQRQNGTYQYKGSYDGSNLLSIFTGLAVDEVYLIRAECAARLGDVDQAINDINKLRSNRMKPETYTALETSDAQKALDWVIDERRKELVLRGTRWEDLRRLNKESRYQKTLVRNLGDVYKELPPGDPRYVWPIPVEASEMGGYEQNIR